MVDSYILYVDALFLYTIYMRHSIC